MNPGDYESRESLFPPSGTQLAPDLYGALHTCAVAANVSHRVRLCAIGSSLGRAGRGFGELRKVGNREALPA